MNKLKNLEQQIEDFKITFLSENWVWRKGQKEAILEILHTYYNKTHKVVILDCPTGSGKSLVAMVVSWILNQDKRNGYILASDISLQEQYEKDFKRFNLNWGSIKGIDNYICNDNHEKNSLGTCRIRSKQPKSMYCYSECPYFKARDHAKESSTSLLNYSYWLISQNYVNQHLDEPIFEPRDFTFCDEAHKILDIVQNHFSPRLDAKIEEKLEKLTNFFKTFKVHDHQSNFKKILLNIEDIFASDNQDKLHEYLQIIELELKSYISSWEILKTKVKTEYTHEEPPREWKEALRLCDWIKDLHCKIEDYNDIIEQTSVRNLVKNPINDKEIVFNCLEESYLMNKYFHQWSGFTILMSATFADPKDYLKSMALKNAKYIKLDSNFNFSESPIYFYNKRRMSYNQISNNLPWLYKTIDEIFDQHSTETGIIHTASYDMALKIYQNVSKKHQSRILMYNGTEEKRQVLEILKRNKNKVLVGPSLTHGLNLFDDLCRFIIVAKIPYPSLGDKFVSAKLKISPEWYRMKTSMEILQGLGRGVRHENDRCVSYILDACLSDLIHNNRSSFPKEFYDRMIVVRDN